MWQQLKTSEVSYAVEHPVWTGRARCLLSTGVLTGGVCSCEVYMKCLLKCWTFFPHRLPSPRKPGPDGGGGVEAWDGLTPLHLSCSAGLDNVVQCLVEHKANVNSKVPFTALAFDRLRAIPFFSLSNWGTGASERHSRAENLPSSPFSARPSTSLTPVSRAVVHLARSSLSITKRKERVCVQSTHSTSM